MQPTKYSIGEMIEADPELCFTIAGEDVSCYKTVIIDGKPYIEFCINSDYYDYYRYIDFHERGLEVSNGVVKFDVYNNKYLTSASSLQVQIWKRISQTFEV